MIQFPLQRLVQGVATLLLAGTILTPALAVMPVDGNLLPESGITAVQFRSGQSGGFRDGGFGGGGNIFRSQSNRPPVRVPPVGVPPVGRPPGRPGGGWGGPVFIPESFPRPRQRPPVIVDDDYEEYVPPPRRRPNPPRRPVVVEVEEDEPVVRRPPARRNTAPRNTAPRRAPVAARPHVTPPPVPIARRAPPRLPPVLVPLATEQRLVRDEVLVELKDRVAADAVGRRHGLTALSTERFTLANISIVRYRVEGNRSARQALATMAGDGRIASAQPNFRYALQQERKPGDETAASIPADAPVDTAQPVPAPAPAHESDVVPAILIEPPAASPAALPAAPLAAPSPVLPPVERKAQYSLGKMGIDAAHRISKGNRVRVAVIDTGVDDAHPELEGTISQRFDALADSLAGSLAGSLANPPADAATDGTSHGTAMAGAIIAKASLQGVSPAAELLVARAFSGGTAQSGSGAGSGAEGTTIHILRSLDWAHAQGARVVNLSFAGPQDRLMSRALLGGSTKGMIAVAAAGNGGPKAKPLFPGADPSVIAVTATDADDRIFPQANTGSYVAVAAPGVDVIAAEPGRRYGFSSGTSMAAAHVSGLVALMLEQKADLDLAGVRTILSETALDLGTKGRDSVFGAGRIDAPAALARTLAPAALK